ncbi:unnamed protein product [Rotaria sp. Silwood1]|nr:unnamed protein product [Rotaria sp. Silwood1]CAF4701529.1 unnamed protein product [Rotaria sp. Silwood1]
MGNKTFTNPNETHQVGPPGKTKTYISPDGWTRYGFKVLGKYQDGNAWLHPFKDPGNWYRAFHGTGRAQAVDFGNDKQSFEKQYAPVDAVASIFENGFRPARITVHGDGVYCSPNPKFPENGYVATVELDTQEGKKKFKCMLQVAVNPDAVRFTKDKDIWVAPNPEDIRPIFLELESIEYTIGNCHLHIKDLPWPSTLTHLSIIFDYDGYFDRIQRSLVHLSSLNSLEIYQKEKGTLLPNGQLWENLIHSSLPLLKIFKFYFQFEYSSQLSNQIEQVISWFSTPFYVLKNKWFIRCDIPDRYHGRAILYSLPFSFQIYTTFQGSIIKTILTLLDDDNNDFYTNIFSNVKKL